MKHKISQMEKCGLIGCLFMSAATAFAASLPLQVGDDGAAVFGDGRLQVAFDPVTCCPKTIAVRGETLIAPDPERPLPVILGAWTPWTRMGKFPPVRGVRVERVSDDTVCGRFTCGDWRFEDYVQLKPDRLAVRRWFAFEWTGTNTVDFCNLWIGWGLFPCAEGGGLYLFPWSFPPARRTRATWQAGRDHAAISQGESPTVADNGRGWSVLAAVDSLQPYSDHLQTIVGERKDGLFLHARTEVCGYAHPGKVQRAGDFWLVFRRGDAEGMLAHMHDWHRLVGHVPPADRPDFVRHLTLYSTQPRGRAMYEPGGFPHAQEYLPFVRALGLDTVWLRPVEDGNGGYSPDDYYKLHPLAGTPEEHLAYVRAAHALGLKVWRDAVMHGGKTDNARSKEHPEWVCLKRDGTQQDTYWAYDFNWPSWVKYFADYVESTTRTYELDGWRMDVPTGSRFPNWNPDVPYDRASYSRNQGGLAQMRAIRAAARRANPNAVTLAEANPSTCGITCDAIYDQLLCHAYFHWFNDRPADTVVRDLSRWLDDQRKSFVPGSVWMRYPESHDAYPCDHIWGRAGATALFAFCAWIEGFPLVMNESEDGAFEAYRHILAVRRALDELNDGVPDYLSEPAPPGVFACRRDNGKTASVFYVNFNGHPVRAGDFDLPPFGYAVRRTKGPSVEEALTAFDRRPFAPILSSGGAEVVAEVRDLTNGLVTAGVRIVREETDGGVRYRIADFGGRQPRDVRLVLRLPPVSRWYAHAAEGTFESPYLVRHPKMDGYWRWGENFDGAVAWDSAYHPFGFVREHAAVGGADGETAWECHGFGPHAVVRVWNRLGGEACCAVSVGGDRPEAFDVTCGRRSAAEALAPRAAGTGDGRLTPAMGGWQYETGGMRLRIRRNGALAGVWRKEADGSWTEVLRTFGVRGRDPAAPKEPRLVWGGRDRDVKEQAFAPFPRAFFARTPHGGLKLEFLSGEMRGIEQNSGCVPHNARATATYWLEDGDAFRMRLGFSAKGTFGKGDWTVEMLAEPPEGKDAADVIGTPEFVGGDPRTVRERGRVRYVYHEPDGPDLKLARERPRTLAVTVRPFPK